MPQFGGDPEALPGHAAVPDGRLQEGLAAVPPGRVNVTDAASPQGVEHRGLGIAAPVGSTYTHHESRSQLAAVNYEGQILSLFSIFPFFFLMYCHKAFLFNFHFLIVKKWELTDL